VVLIWGVAEPVHHRLEVGAAGKEPGGMGMPQIVHPHRGGKTGGQHGGPPDLNPEGVP